jgi:glycosyltransferase involved in cell wall biosynthesis
MVERPLHILQVNTLDGGGGAGRVAHSLHQAYRDRGHASCLVVGSKLTGDDHVRILDNSIQGSLWSRPWLWAADRLSPASGRVRGIGRLRNMLRLIGQPRALLDVYRGHEDFGFPGTGQLLHGVEGQPDIVHCHNLHGPYFDLRILPTLTRRMPVVLTLHDAWLLSGHCDHSLGCDRWKVGCGKCPDLRRPHRIRRDATAFNWQRKKMILAESRLYVASPSRWLMDKVEQSMLAEAAIESRVIPNGVDLSIFSPGSKTSARSKLGIPQEARVLLFAAMGVRRNIWKDHKTIETAIIRVAERAQNQHILFVALGDDSPTQRIGQAEIRSIPFEDDIKIVAEFYRAADIYVHAARADTFPNTVLEAMACGTPVVATAVGGIPEQVQEGRTGFLVPPGDSEAMAARIILLLSDDECRRAFGEGAANVARQRFDLSCQVETYLAWYRSILELNRMECRIPQSVM